MKHIVYTTIEENGEVFTYSHRKRFLKKWEHSMTHMSICEFEKFLYNNDKVSGVIKFSKSGYTINLDTVEYGFELRHGIVDRYVPIFKVRMRVYKPETWKWKTLSELAQARKGMFFVLS